MAQTRYDNVSAGEYARQHNGNVTNNYRYNYNLRTRRSDETLREDQRNILLLRAAAEGQLPRMQHLFRLGVDIDFSDDEGFMALHHAVVSGFEDCVRELISWGSDVNAMTRYGAPLNLAAQKERGHVISILVGARADTNRAVAFATRHGQSVGDLCSLLDIPITRTTAEPLSSFSVGGDDALEEARLAVPVAVEADTRTSDEPNHLHHATKRESATKNDKSRHTDLQHDSSAGRDESRTIGGPETSAGNQEEDLGRRSVSEDLLEKTNASYSSQQSVRQPKRKASRSHKNLWRKRGVTDVEDLSVLTPNQWRQPDSTCEDYDTPRAHQGTHSIFSEEVTGELVWRELLQPPPSVVGLWIGSEVCQKLDIDLDNEYRDMHLRNSQKVKLHVRDWLLQQPPVMLNLVPQSDRSTSQKLNVQVPVDNRHTKESANRRPRRTEIPTDDGLAALASGKSQSETTKAGGEQHLTAPIRRRASEEPSTPKATDELIRPSERTENLSPNHESSKPRLRRKEKGRRSASGRLTPDAADSKPTAGYGVQIEGLQKPRMTNNPRLLEMVEGSIRRMLLPEVMALEEEQRAERRGGKYTIASILANELMEGQCMLIHNNDLIDAVKVSRDHLMYPTLRKDERMKSFAQHVLAPEERGKCVIFTDSQCNKELDAAVAAEYRDAAAAVERPFVPVYLRLSRDENVRRIASSSRVESGTGKLVDASVLLPIRDSCDLFEFSDVKGLSLDVTEINAEESARRIYQYVCRFFQSQPGE